jgi:formate dehydrogenase beta subunit/formate dehydrogenase gamma subunit
VSGLAIKRVSATDARVTVREADTVAMLIDTTTCIGCKACEVACVEWNDLKVEPETGTRMLQSFQTMPEMTPSFWNLIRFDEVSEGPGLAMHMRKDMCMHCAEPGCLIACPAEGAIVQYVNGIVDFNHEACVGCGYCMTGCPFNVPKFDTASERVFKCTMCSDRVSNGLGPACVKACPTGCLEFGSKDEMKRRAEKRAEVVKSDGHAFASVYDPSGVGGTGVIYVLKDKAERYGALPPDPKIDPKVGFWKGPLKLLGGASLGLSLAGAALHYLIAGPRKTHEPSAAEASPREVVRYTFFERALHWTVAFTFLYLSLTGLGLFTPKLGWLLDAFGGGQVVRAWHPIVGAVFVGAVLVQFLKWFKDLLVTGGDLLWLRKMRDYLAGRDANVPPTGRFNAGQKLLFWTQIVLALVLLASGVPIWFPESFSRELRLWAVVVHSAAGVLAMLSLVVHIYMAAFVTRGAVRAMTEGKVSEAWARHHHGLWADEVLGPKK